MLSGHRLFVLCKYTGCKLVPVYCAQSQSDAFVMLWFLENTKSNFGEELALLFAGLILENTKSKLGESLAHLFTG